MKEKSDKGLLYKIRKAAAVSLLSIGGLGVTAGLFGVIVTSRDVDTGFDNREYKTKLNARYDLKSSEESNLTAEKSICSFLAVSCIPFFAGYFIYPKKKIAYWSIYEK